MERSVVRGFVQCMCLRFTFVPIFHQQEDGDEANQDYRPTSNGPFPKWAELS